MNKSETVGRRYRNMNKRAVERLRRYLLVEEPFAVYQGTENAALRKLHEGLCEIYGIECVPISFNRRSSPRYSVGRFNRHTPPLTPRGAKIFLCPASWPETVFVYLHEFRHHIQIVHDMKIDDIEKDANDWAESLFRLASPDLFERWVWRTRYLTWE